MPNIEIHTDDRGCHEKISAFRRSIQAYLAKFSFAKDCVITIVQGDCKNAEWEDSPFFRIYVTQEDPVEEIIMAIKACRGCYGYNIEVAPLLRFVPKDS